MYLAVCNCVVCVCMQEHKVNLALWGHEHAYQRSCPVYRNTCVNGNNGTVHVIVGMGGQRHNPPSYYP